jgi:flagellar L-ring protein precursor FlgH
MSRNNPIGVCALGALVLMWPATVAAQQPTAGKSSQVVIPAKDAYDVYLQRYLQSARDLALENRESIRWMVGLSGDRRARELNDVVTIRVVESVVAEGSADTALGKKSDAAASVTKLFGLETKLPDWIDPAALVDTASNTDFKGSGTTNRRGNLTAMVTARVVEVLPNGDLVLEGAREIDINGDRQVIVLTGVVRTADILPDNSVLSPRIGQFRIRYFGQGLIKDNLKPGWIVRILNKIF